MDINLEDALELSNQNHQRRVEKKKEKSRQSRVYQDFESLSRKSTLLSSSSLFEINYSPVVLSSIDAHTLDVNTDADTSDTESDVIYYDIDEYIQSIENVHLMFETSLLNSNLHLDEASEKDNSIDFDQLLHPYSDTHTDSFCYRLLRFLREAGLSKTERHKLLELIRFALPIPNNLPSNMNKILSMLQMKHNLFKKRKMCIFCYHDLPDDIRFCLDCPTSNEKDIAFIYDSDIKFILSSLLKTLWEEIDSFKEQIQTGDDTSDTKDIGFGSAYQHLLNQFPNETFITALMHLDGVGLCKSNKLKL